MRLVGSSRGARVGVILDDSSATSSRSASCFNLLPEVGTSAEVVKYGDISTVLEVRREEGNCLLSPACDGAPNESGDVNAIVDGSLEAPYGGGEDAGAAPAFDMRVSLCIPELEKGGSFVWTDGSVFERRIRWSAPKYFTEEQAGCVAGRVASRASLGEVSRD